MAVEVHGAPLSGDPFTDRRRSGIGGSDAGAILGVSPWASALSVWEDKRGIAQEPRPTSERMVWGSRLEGAIIAGYEEDTGRKVRRGGRAFRRHPVYSFLVGHPDGLSDDGRLVEVKTTAHLDSRWGEPGSADVPPHYYAQVQHYLVLTGMEVADLLALVGGRELVTFTLPADRDFQEALLDEEAAFWQKVRSGEPPDPDGSDSAAQTLRRLFPRAMPEEVVATPEVAAMAEAYLTHREQRDALDREVQRYAQLIQAFMGSRERLLGPGFAATWGNRAGSVSWKSVAQMYRQALEASGVAPGILDAIQAEAQGQPSRVFSLTQKRAEP